MPAMTLGLAEVEERLRLLRRRLNVVTAVHAASLSVSTVLLVAAALIPAGLYGSVEVFRVATWAGVAVSLAVVAACAVAARRRWLTVAATARLADQRGQLTDRLTTLFDLRQRPRPSRLAPVLVAQTLALGERWRVQRIAPRRLPRSLALVPLSLLALSASPLLAPDPPPPAPPSATTPAPPAAPDAAAPAASAGSPATAGENEAPGEMPSGQFGALPGAEGAAPRDPAHSPPRGEPVPPESLIGLLPDQLRHAILGAFHAEQMDRPRELAAQPNRAAGGGSSDSRPGERTDEQRDRGRGGEHDRPTAKRGDGAGDQQMPGKLTKNGDAVLPNRDNAAEDQRRDGSSPSAGSGSRPEGLLAGKGGGEIAVGKDGATTFKLTITSFLRGIEEKGNRPRPSDKPSSPGAPGVATADSAAPLSDRQLNDDVLRKAEIPPEYEDLVRRVYAPRVDE